MGGKVQPGILTPSALLLFGSSQSKCAANSLHLSTVSTVPSGLGHWQAGSSRQLESCEKQWHISLASVLPTYPAEGVAGLCTPDSWLFCSFCSWWENQRLGVMGMP